MRWFKHLTMAHEDAGLATLAEELGAGGYGIYWFLLEHFGSVMEKDCARVPTLVHSDLRWAKICCCSTRMFRTFVERAAELKLIESRTPAELKQYSSRTPAKRFEICIPKLLKYRDEYSRKSGVAPDKLPARVDTHTDTDGEQITPPTPSPEGEPVETPKADPPPPPKTVSKIDQEFEEDWPLFWVQLDKKTARTAYRKARDEISRELLIRAVIIQGPLILQRARTTGSTPVYPATWLNGGRYADNQRHLEGLAAAPARASPTGRREKANEEFRQRMLREARERETEKLDFTGGS